MIITNGLPKPEYSVMKYLRKEFHLDSDREALTLALAVCINALHMDDIHGENMGIEWITNTISTLRSVKEKDRKYFDIYGEVI